jgi:hypothetical protein
MQFNFGAGFTGAGQLWFTRGREGSTAETVE